MSDQELWDRNYEAFRSMERTWEDVSSSAWGDFSDGWDDPDEQEGDDW